nr:hypothetical protein [uncultured Mediterranean phage uvMED]
MTFPILGGNGAVAVGEANSLRFNDGDSAKLARTPSGAGNKKTWTWSGWVKRSNLGAIQGLFTVDTGSGESALGFLADDTLRFFLNIAPNYPTIVPNQVFRDTSSWYHIVVSVDTTQSTESNRVKIYVNGSQVTSFSSASYPSQNVDTEFNTTNPHEIGFYSNQTGGAGHFDGYMAEAHFIDGTAKAPTDFGEFDSTSGIWKPIEYSGSYGTNGFKLNFSDSGSLGADSSGNGNNFTATNLASTDQTTDTPQNNFATWNTVIPMNSTMTMAEGNLEGKTGSNYASGASNTWFSTMGVSSGKWYAEFKMTQNSASYGSLVGVSYDIDTNQQGSTANANNFCQHSSMTSGWGYSNDGSWFNGANYDLSGTDYDTYTTNDIIGVALDLDNSKLYWSKNGTYQNSANPETGSNGISIDANEEYYFAISDTSLGNTYTFQANFGNPVYSITSGNNDDNGYGNFEYAPPSGYLALCTQNLATELSPTIDDGSAYFHTQLYTGNGTSQTITNDAYSGDFQPDFLWIKNRQQSDWHNLINSTVGATKRIASNNNLAENTNANNVSAFASDGFSVGSDHNTNANGENYVAWQWKANGGTTSSNTDGSITSTVSANQTAGFSVVSYTGTGSGSTTVGHGLAKVPAMIIVKDRGQARSWNVYHQSIGNNSGVNLNGTGAQSGADSGWWNNTSPTSSVFTLGTYANESSDYVSYCFAEIEGYSKIGKYTGNGNADGTFVYTGFKPAWVMIKRTDASGDNWVICDNKRDTFNVMENILLPNTGSAEFDETSFDFLSNGFKLRQSAGTYNASGGTIIYMCFASSPFVDSNGVPVTAR